MFYLPSARAPHPNTANGRSDSYTTVFCSRHFWRLHLSGPKFCRLLWKNIPTAPITETTLHGGDAKIFGMSHFFGKVRVLYRFYWRWNLRTNCVTQFKAKGAQTPHNTEQDMKKMHTWTRQTLPVPGARLWGTARRKLRAKKREETHLLFQVSPGLINIRSQ